MYKYIYSIYNTMEKECGIRVSERLRNKIKKAALAKSMSMVDYLESIVPEITMVEMPK
jgi:hypothetical protein